MRDWWLLRPVCYAGGGDYSERSRFHTRAKVAEFIF
jgi:hypothetical protein